MPTAAKFISAVLFMVLSYYTATIVAAHAANGDYLPYVSSAQSFRMFPFVCGFVGLFSGWYVVGQRTGRGTSSAFWYGVRTSATAVFFVLVIFSVQVVVTEALRMRYHGPLEAIQAMFGKAADFAHVLLTPEVLALLFFGGGLAGVVAEAVGRRWR